MAPHSPETAPRRPRAGNGRVVLVCLAVTFGMLGAAFASVPFYRWFCAATGYEGTPQVGSAAPAAHGERRVTVRFDANVFPGLPWDFAPETPNLTLVTGEAATVLFRIENRSDRPTSATASFNVAPPLAGAYFTKLACFCFTEQVLAPHEVIEAPVTFYVDPAIETDKNLAGLTGLTLSYTFFVTPPTSSPARQAAADPAAVPPRL